VKKETEAEMEKERVSGEDWMLITDILRRSFPPSVFSRLLAPPGPGAGPVLVLGRKCWCVLGFWWPSLALVPPAPLASPELGCAGIGSKSLQVLTTEMRWGTARFDWEGLSAKNDKLIVHAAAQGAVRARGVFHSRLSSPT
jgi:hypothetical protein